MGLSPPRRDDRSLDALGVAEDSRLVERPRGGDQLADGVGLALAELHPQLPAGEEELQPKKGEGPIDGDLKLGERSVLIRREAEFVQDPETGSTVIRVYDSKTREVLFEFPPERLQEFRKLFREAVGNLLDETV